MVPFPAVHFSLIPWDFYLILAVLAALVPWRGAVRIRRLLGQPTFGGAQRLSLYRTTIFFQWLIAGAVAWRAFFRNLSPAELGLTVSDHWKTSWIAVVLTALLCVNQWASLRQIMRNPEMQHGLPFRIAQKIAPRTSTEIAAYVGLACTAGLSEEFLYRGFAFAVFARLFAQSGFPVPIAAVMSSAWFGIGHSYQGHKGIITTFVVGIIFSMARVSSGSLIPSVVAHAGFDLVAGIYASRFGLEG